MKLLDRIDPEELIKIDKTKNIILCTPPSDKNIIETKTPDIFSILLTQDINLSLGEQITPNIIAMEYSPRLKILVPSGIKLNIITDTESNKTGSIFSKIYCNYDIYHAYESEINTELKYKIYNNISFTLYIDVIQMRKKINSLLISKGEPIIDLYFSWYIQTQREIPMIENIYLIKDLYIFQEFAKVI